MTDEKAAELKNLPKKYEELDFTDDFLFCKILTNNLDLCRQLLEVILDMKIQKVKLPENQKTIKITREGKGIRLDVYAEDEENTVYDIEMQAADTKNLPRRSRYYQGMLDLNLISKGENYKKLKKCYIIFICRFDLFGENLSRYTFENLCREKPEIKLGDESLKVFICPSERKNSVSPKLQALLNYLSGKGCEDTFTRKIDKEVKKARECEEWKVEYMTLLMRDQENMEKGMERGRIEGRKEGRREGRREGRKEGQIEGRKQILTNMLKRGMSVEQIAELCAVTEEEVKEVQRKL